MPTIFIQKGYRFFLLRLILMNQSMYTSKNLAAMQNSGRSLWVWQSREGFASMNSLKLNELSTVAPPKSSLSGRTSSAKGTIAIVNVELDDYRTLAPVLIPDLDEIRAFAQRLHSQRQAWEGEAFGWNAGYNPSSSEPPPDSKMTFTPADFWMGDGALWFFALMWEAGDDEPPVETVYDKNIIGSLEK